MESFADGRDELNLADFPISVLQRQQPVEVDGRKLDQVVYESSTYDPVGRRRVPQRVTLTTSSRVGLPTPADENVVLALLYTAKRESDFGEPRVHFSPHQLFRLMRWDVNSRSYARLSQVLLRLKSLTILYENAWWDPSGHKYQEEFATGIVAEYRLVKTRLRRKANVAPPSYVHWTPQFAKSLASGNLKKLNLDRLFSLSLPTSQRMYRFLDKRFYLTPQFEIDLRDFACGHLGVTSTPNIAELKRRVAPALAELEAIGFLEPSTPEERYVKLKKGIWRIRFRRAGVAPAFAPAPAPALASPPAPGNLLALPAPVAVAVVEPPEDEGAKRLVLAFYRSWSPEGRFVPTAGELGQAREIVVREGVAQALELVGPVAALMRSKFPSAKRFGASIPYFEEAARAVKASSRRVARELVSTRRREEERQEEQRRQAADDAFLQAWTPAWEALSEPEREAIRSEVLRTQPYLSRPLLRGSRLALRFFLEELARRTGDG